MLKPQPSSIDALPGVVNAQPQGAVRVGHPGCSEERFRRRDVLTLHVGNDQVLLVGDPARQELVSRADFALLHGCTRFATLEAHLEAH